MNLPKFYVCDINFGHESTLDTNKISTKKKKKIDEEEIIR